MSDHLKNPNPQLGPSELEEACQRADQMRQERDEARLQLARVQDISQDRSRSIDNLNRMIARLELDLSHRDEEKASLNDELDDLATKSLVQQEEIKELRRDIRQAQEERKAEEQERAIVSGVVLVDPEMVRLKEAVTKVEGLWAEAQGIMASLKQDYENLSIENAGLKAAHAISNSAASTTIDELRRQRAAQDIAQRITTKGLDELKIEYGKLKADEYAARFREPIFVVLLTDGEDIIRRFFAGPPDSPEELNKFQERISKWLNASQTARERTPTHHAMKAQETLANAFQKRNTMKKPASE